MISPSCQPSPPTFCYCCRHCWMVRDHTVNKPCVLGCVLAEVVLLSLGSYGKLRAAFSSLPLHPSLPTSFLHLSHVHPLLTLHYLRLCLLTGDSDISWVRPHTGYVSTCLLTCLCVCRSLHSSVRPLPSVPPTGTSSITPLSSSSPITPHTPSHPHQLYCNTSTPPLCRTG